MSVIGKLLGLGEAVDAAGRTARGLAEVFTPNATRRMELSAAAHAAALDEAGVEFAHAGPGRFDRFVNALNRLPRPLLALGVLGLFTYAMADPPGFTLRMQGLAAVPEPLWWLLGAVVSFYFGARETHYFRTGREALAPRRAGAAEPERASGPKASPKASPETSPEVAAVAADNPALAEWERGRQR